MYMYVCIYIYISLPPLRHRVLMLAAALACFPYVAFLVFRNYVYIHMCIYLYLSLNVCIYIYYR